jgi:hypothetical protein
MALGSNSKSHLGKQKNGVVQQFLFGLNHMYYIYVLPCNTQHIDFSISILYLSCCTNDLSALSFKHNFPSDASSSEIVKMPISCFSWKI